MIFRFVLVWTLIILVGCGPSTKQVMDSWKGHRVSSIIRNWGPPQQVVSDGAGGQIYIWKNRIHLQLANATTETEVTVTHNAYSSRLKSKTTYTPPLVLEGDRVRCFYVNSQGVVYHWYAKGFINDPEEDAVWIMVLVVSLAALVYMEYTAQPEYPKLEPY